jgi:hypothetical protein
LAARKSRCNIIFIDIASGFKNIQLTLYYPQSKVTEGSLSASKGKSQYEVSLGNSPPVIPMPWRVGTNKLSNINWNSNGPDWRHRGRGHRHRNAG